MSDEDYVDKHLKRLVEKGPYTLASLRAEVERLTGERDRQYDQNAEQIIRIAALENEVERYQRSFSVRREASMRAIRRWQEAHPGNDLNWPDHADLVVWLLEQDAALRAEKERLRAALGRARTVLGNMALENEGAIFNRWPIHHEPLRADARNLLPVIDAALGEPENTNGD